MLQKRSELIRIFFIRLWKGRHNTTDIRLLKSTVAIMKTCIYYIFYQGMITIPFIHPQTHTTKRHTLSPYLEPYRIYVRNTYGNIRQRSLASMHIVIGAIKKTETGTRVWRETRLAKQTEEHVKAEPWYLPLDSSHVERISETGQGRFCEGVAYGRMPREARQQSIVRARNKSVDALLTLSRLHKRRCTTTSRCPLHVVSAASGLWLC